MKFQETLYSFRLNRSVMGSLSDLLNPDYEALRAIDAKLNEASRDFYARRYQDAIAAYNAAAALIYAHLDPGFPFHIGGIDGRIRFSRDPRLFDSVLSAGLEWLNVLPVRQPPRATVPRVAPDPVLLQTTADYDQTGVVSAKLKQAGAWNAVAEFQLSKSYESQGNAAAAKTLMDRARATDSATIGALTQAPAAPAAPPPSFVVAPGAFGLGSAVTHPATFESAPGFARSLALGGPADFGLHGIALPPPVTTAADRFVGTRVAGKTVTFSWSAGQTPATADVRAGVYQGRVAISDLGHLINHIVLPSDLALNLPHLYYYVIPLGLAECYHALGDYATSESEYLHAAGYQYLNSAIEAPYLWLRLATLYLDWGNSLYRQDQAADALPIYQRVLNPDNTVPQTSALYSTPSLKPGADAARTAISNLDKLVAGQATATTLNINPELAAVVLDVYQELQKINGGLDFWGHVTNTVPIWTFDYLQSVAINFTQLAMAAERDFISFREKADQSALTREQLAQTATQAKAEADAAALQVIAMRAEQQTYNDAAALAAQRQKDAIDNAAEYSATSSQAIVMQALQSQMSGGDDGDLASLNAKADEFIASGGDPNRAAAAHAPPAGWNFFGQPWPTTGWHWDANPSAAAGAGLAAARLNQQYESDSLKRQATEMGLAAKQAQSEQIAAAFRTVAAQAAQAAAQLRADNAAQLVHDFDQQFFTPDVWQRMADVMLRLYRRYLYMAIRAARLMQRAYNFETDQSLHIIRGDYATDEVNGLLAADSLMADIQSFTYNLITSRAGKPQPIKHTISLAERYGFLFEKQFRKTGSMKFETRIDDFDNYYPGTYAGRIEGIELEVDGIVPPTGVSGTLTNSGISAYRMPASLWPANASGLKYRVQSKETLVLSDYSVRQDAPLAPDDQRMLRVFQGAGVASSWELALPKAVNDIDYGALTDVRITFYYKARFDADLRNRVLQDLATRPALNSAQRGMPLRWLYPDAFFRFQDTGQLTMALTASDFRSNQTKPVLTEIGVLIVTDGSVPAKGLNLALSTPTHAAVTAAADASGYIGSRTSGSAWKPLAGGTALGQYTVALAAASNPSRVQGGKLVLKPIVNIGLIIGYSFTPKS